MSDKVVVTPAGGTEWDDAPQEGAADTGGNNKHRNHDIACVSANCWWFSVNIPGGEPTPSRSRAAQHMTRS
eukprot:8870-Prorocentrum_minimum.AAC.1